jgi:guanylate kinase
MRKANEKIVCIVGQSGSGKTFLTNMLRERGWSVLDSLTTRPPRKENELGHTFVTQEEFDALRADFIAYTEFDGYEYATTKKQFEESQFYVIDPAGVEWLSEKVGRDKFVIVFINASDKRRYNRMAKERNGVHAKKRVVHDKEKFRSFIDNEEWDCIINNNEDDLSNANINVRLLERFYRFSNE